MNYNLKNLPERTVKPRQMGFTMAMDKGLITPKMKLPYIPVNFSGYARDNFDMQFWG